MRREGEMEKIKDFIDLKVWQKAHQAVVEIYKITQNFPTDEKFGLNKISG